MSGFEFSVKEASTPDRARELKTGNLYSVIGAPDLKVQTRPPAASVSHDA